MAIDIKGVVWCLLFAVISFGSIELTGFVKLQYPWMLSGNLLILNVVIIVAGCLVCAKIVYAITNRIK